MGGVIKLSAISFCSFAFFL